MKKIREVYIELAKNNWNVCYVNRTKGQRYRAAGFYVPDSTREQVVEWIKTQPHLTLVEKPEAN